MSEVSDKIAKILEDPENIKMISEIAESFLGNNSENVKSFQSNNFKTESEKGDNTDETADKSQSLEKNPITAGETASLGTLQQIISEADIENTVKLISALKPYMGTHRKESADSVLKILNVIKIIEKTNLTELSKLFGMFG